MIPEISYRQSYTWNKCCVAILIAMGISIWISGQIPPQNTYFIPPFHGHESLIRGLLGLLWVPMLIYFLLKRPRGTTFIPLIITLLGLPLIAIYSMYIVFGFRSRQCMEEIFSSDKLRYICQEPMYDIESYIADKGSILMQLERLMTSENEE